MAETSDRGLFPPDVGLDCFRHNPIVFRKFPNKELVMPHVPEAFTEQLSLALKHFRHASQNLQNVHHWAVQNNRVHLEQGAMNLINQVSRVTGDLATLITVLEARSARLPNSV